MATMNEQTVHNFLEARGNLWPPTATEIAEETGIALSTVYVALKSIHAERTKRGKNQFGYVLPDPVEVEFPAMCRHGLPLTMPSDCSTLGNSTSTGSGRT